MKTIILALILVFVQVCSVSAEQNSDDAPKHRGAGRRLTTLVNKDYS
jgi:hypothetical protein